MKIKRIISGAMFLFIAIVCQAGPIDREEAMAKAKAFLESRGNTAELQTPSSRIRMKAPSGSEYQTREYFHIFNIENNGGFVIVSADDRTAEILGYVDNGEFDSENMPENMRSWLQHYADEIEALPTDAPANNRPRKVSTARHSIAPMVTTRWNQGNPYNLMCPTYYNADGSSGQAVTGCTQTAFAQVLNFYKYPAATKRRIPAHSCKYDLSDGTSKTSTLKAIPAGTVIDWDNMLDNYYGSETEEQNMAVAQLMVLIGQSLKASYGSSTGASFSLAHKLLVDFLGYDDGVYVANSDEYSIQDWDNKIYNELDLGYPIIFCGFSTGGGHAFVIDGFNGEDLYHLNWGWGGGSDGYFRLTVLNPGDNSGIGASSSADGYSMGQQAVFNLRPENDGIECGVESKPHMTINNTKIEGTSISSQYINWTGEAGSFNGAIVARNAEGVLTPMSDVYKCENLGANYMYTWSFDMKGRFSEPGTYRLTPASKLVSSPEYYPRYNLETEYIQAEVDNALNVTLTKVEPYVELEVTDWNFPGSLKSGEQQDVTITVKNHGDEFKREVALYASTTGNKGDAVSRAMLCVEKGKTEDFTFFFKPNTTGTYNLWLTRSGQPDAVIAHTTVNVGTTPHNNASLKVTSFNIKNNAYGNCLVGNISIKNNLSTPFKGNVKIVLWLNTEGNSCVGRGSAIAEIDVNGYGTATAPFEFYDLAVGRNYFLSVDYTTQSGALENGNLVWGHNWELKPGYLTWSTTGSISGVAESNTVSISNSTAGALFDGTNIATINPGSNPNTIYAFSSTANVPASLEGCNVVNSGTAESINLVSGKAAYSPIDFTAKKATFSHTFSKVGNGSNGWEAITLPFKPARVTIDGNEVEWKKRNDNGSFWLCEFAEINDDNEVVFRNVPSIEALRGSTPYIIAAPEELNGKTVVFEGEDVSFISTNKDKMVVSAEAFRFYGTTLNMQRVSNIFVMNDEGDAYEYITSNKSVNPYKNYFVWNGDEANRPEKISLTNAAVGIKEINVVTDNSIYDLQGRKVANPAKGLYIKNGKKVIIK